MGDEKNPGQERRSNESPVIFSHWKDLEKVDHSDFLENCSQVSNSLKDLVPLSPFQSAMAASMSSRAFIVLAVLIARVTAINPCYFPNGDAASNYVPCSPNGDGGCCLSGDFCTSLGYCISNLKGYHYRGACTDSSWFNPSCPRYCLTNNNSGNSTSVNVIACNAAITGGSWCCAYNTSNCCDTDSVYIPTFGTIFAEPGTSSTSSPGSGSATQSSTSSAATVSSTLQSSNSSSNSTRTKDSSNNMGVIVGAAVGVPLGLAAIATLALYIRERRKRQNMRPAVPEKKPYGYYEGHGGGALPPAASIQAASELQQPVRGNEYSRANIKPHELSSQRTHELPAPQ